MKITIKRATRRDREAFEEARSAWLRFREDLVLAAEILHQGNIATLEQNARNHELQLARKLLQSFEKPRRGPLALDFPVCQSGETCVPMSALNGLRVLDQSQFPEDPRELLAFANHFLDDFLATEPGHKQSSERRSLDSVQRYFAKQKQQRLNIQGHFDFELSGGLLDMVYAFHSEDGVVLSVFQAHCQLAFGLFISPNGQPWVEMQDPLVRNSRLITLEDFALRFVWSALGGLPHAVSVGASYTSRDALKLLEDQAARGHRGVLCSSGILRRCT